MGLLEFSEIKSKLERYCAYQERSVYEVEKKIRTFTNQEAKIELLVSEMTKDGFLNQSRFVESFVQGKVNLKKWGKQKIRMGLIQHKISKELIDQGLKNIPKEKYDHNLSGLAKKKALTLKEGLSALKRKGRFYAFFLLKDIQAKTLTVLIFRRYFLPKI